MTRSIEEILRPRTEEEVRRALTRFAQDARRHYGSRLKGLYLFGSRARGDHEPDSDADVAVVLEDGPWKYRDERRALSDLTYDRLIDDGVEIQTIPIAASEWTDPRRHHNPSLVCSMKRDAHCPEALA
jgi:predicted nucleotidyltransferase